MVNTDNCVVNVAPALAAESEGSGLGGFEGVASPVCGYLFRYRLDLSENRRCGIDADCSQRQGFACVSGSIAQRQFTVTVLSVAGKADGNFRLALLHMK